MLLDGEVGHFVCCWSLDWAIGHDGSIGDLRRRAGWRSIASSSITLRTVFSSCVEAHIFPLR